MSFSALLPKRKRQIVDVLLDVCAHFLAILADQRLAAALHGLAGEVVDLLMLHGLPDVLDALLIGKVGDHGVAHVVEEKLALDVEAEGRVGNQAHQIGISPLKAALSTGSWQ